MTPGHSIRRLVISPIRRNLELRPRATASDRRFPGRLRDFCHRLLPAPSFAGSAKGPAFRSPTDLATALVPPKQTGALEGPLGAVTGSRHFAGPPLLSRPPIWVHLKGRSLTHSQWQLYQSPLELSVVASSWFPASVLGGDCADRAQESTGRVLGFHQLSKAPRRTHAGATGHSYDLVGGGSEYGRGRG